MDRDSHIDNLIKQTLKGEGLEMPPVDFSNKVMDRISKLLWKIFTSQSFQKGFSFLYWPVLFWLF